MAKTLENHLTLDLHLRQVRSGHDCEDPECHVCEAAHHIRKLIEALEDERDELMGELQDRSEGN